MVAFLLLNVPNKIPTRASISCSVAQPIDGLAGRLHQSVLQYRNNMKTSELLQSSSLSLPSDSYIYSVIPVIGNTTIAAISSDDTLSIFDSTTLQVISNCAFGKIHDGVTCLKNLDAKAGVLVTVGRDAKIQCFDPRTGRNPSLELRHGNDIGAAW